MFSTAPAKPFRTISQLPLALLCVSLECLVIIDPCSFTLKLRPLNEVDEGRPHPV